MKRIGLSLYTVVDPDTRRQRGGCTGFTRELLFPVTFKLIEMKTSRRP